MENNFEQQQKTEGENMNFVISDSMLLQVQALVKMTGLVEGAIPIPESNGQVLVRMNTQAYLERVNESGTIMIPVKLFNGRDSSEQYFICSE